MIRWWIFLKFTVTEATTLIRMWRVGHPGAVASPTGAAGIEAGPPRRCWPRKMRASYSAWLALNLLFGLMAVTNSLPAVSFIFFYSYLWRAKEKEKPNRNFAINSETWLQLNLADFLFWWGSITKALKQSFLSMRIQIFILNNDSMQTRR